MGRHSSNHQHLHIFLPFVSPSSFSTFFPTFLFPPPPSPFISGKAYSTKASTKKRKKKEPKKPAERKGRGGAQIEAVLRGEMGRKGGGGGRLLLHLLLWQVLGWKARGEKKREKRRKQPRPFTYTREKKRDSLDIERCGSLAGVDGARGRRKRRERKREKERQKVLPCVQQKLRIVAADARSSCFSFLPFTTTDSDIDF